MKLRSLSFAAVFAVGAMLSSGAFGQTATDYPNRTVRIVVNFSAGGATDIVARMLAQKLTDLWGQSVIVENRGRRSRQHRRGRSRESQAGWLHAADDVRLGDGGEPAHL